MNKLRCFLFATIVMLSGATLALGGIMQTPGHSDPPPPPPASASTIQSTDGTTSPTSTDEIQIAWQDLTTTTLLEILFTIY